MAGEVGEDLERDVGTRADFQHCAEIDETADELGILNGADAMADAGGFDEVESIRDAESTADFTGMDGEAEAGFTGDVEGTGVVADSMTAVMPARLVSSPRPIRSTWSGETMISL